MKWLLTPVSDRKSLVSQILHSDKIIHQYRNNWGSDGCESLKYYVLSIKGVGKTIFYFLTKG